MSVPHHLFLRAAALVSLGSMSADDVGATLQEELYAPVHGEWADIVRSVALSHLPPYLETLFLTTDVRADSRPFFLAAEALNVSEVVAMMASGPALAFPDTVRAWRSNKTLRMHIETYQLAGISDDVLAQDLKKLYGRTFDLPDLGLHRKYFCDRAWLSVPGGWESYEECVGAAEASFKRGLLAQPEEYLRWKMGVPVTLDTDKILDRLISDAYFDERELKSRGEYGKDDLARVKLGRDTIFKAMDRKLKKKALEIEAATAGGGDAMSKAADAISKIAVRRLNHQHRSLESLKNDTE